jgi:PAT family beta-lactamase induction signal transducer AmpG
LDTFLNFASGLPYAIIISVSVIMYKTWGLMNIGIYTSLLYLPDKTIMESIYRLVRHQEKMVLAMQLVISIAFLLVGLTIPMNNFFVISLAIFLGRGFASASNDVASDGFYMLALEKEQQSFS